MLDTSRVGARLSAARAEADKVNLRAQLEKQLTYLENYAQPKVTRCTLFFDAAPYSFAFSMEYQDRTGNWSHWFSGGLIYHGPHDGHGSGEAPTWAVSVVPVHGWQIHT